ncbi:uncharacterized protein LOC144146726 [Haemaphysalis longicornis]
MQAGNCTSAFRRGTSSSGHKENTYKIVLPRLPTGTVGLNTVFLHADLKGRPHRAPDFRDALVRVMNLKDVISIGQYQMSHVWMVTCVSALATQKFVDLGSFPVKSLKCMVFDPDSREVKVKLVWLPRHMESRRIVEALEPYGAVQSVNREIWRCPGMEHMETSNRDVCLELKEGVSVSSIPHMLDVYGIQSLVLIPGRPPLCLRCSRTGHVRLQCRTPRCYQCRRYGHAVENCVMTYADKLRQGQAKTTEDETSEQLMDASEVTDASGEVSVAPGLATVSQQYPSANLETPQHDPALRKPKPPDGGF